MKSETLVPTISQQSTTITIKPIKPLLFDFFVSNRPTPVEQITQKDDIRNQSYFSQRLEYSRSFRPKLNCKKLIEEPNFLLSVEKKKIKVINGLGKRANPETPSRKHYRGSKVRSSTNKTLQEQ